MSHGSSPSTGDAETPSERWLRGARRFLEERRRPVGMAGLALVALVWCASGWVVIGHNEAAIVLRFGAMRGPDLVPGLHLTWPWPIDRLQRARIDETRSVEIAGAYGESLSFLTADENLVEAKINVHYQVVHLDAFLLGAEDVPELVRQTVLASGVEEFASSQVDEVLTFGRVALQEAVRRSAQEKLARLGLGISLTAVNLQNLGPPLEAATAFREVVDARAQAAEAINRAEAEGQRQLGLARGEGTRLQEEARATAGARQHQARGAADRFAALAAANAINPELVVGDLRRRTLLAALRRVKIVVLPPGAKPHLELNSLRTPPPWGAKPDATSEKAPKNR